MPWWRSSRASGDPSAEMKSRCLSIKLAVRIGKFEFGHRGLYRQAIEQVTERYRRAIYLGCRCWYWGKPGLLGSTKIDSGLILGKDRRTQNGDFTRP